MPLSKKIASFCEDFKQLEIPVSVYDKATEGIVDGTGVGIAAKNYDFAQSIIKTLSQLSEKGDISLGFNIMVHPAPRADAIFVHI